MTQVSSSISPFTVFKKRNFTLLWTAQFVSMMGTALSSLAASIYIFRLTGSVLSVGLMWIATVAPGLLVGLFAGVIVDRYDRRKIMITADIVQAALTAMIPLSVRSDIVWLYVIMVINSTLTQFYGPAHDSVLPEVATDRELSAANSLMSISSFGSTAVGYAAAGFIASAASMDWAFYLDAVTFIISAACIYLMRIKSVQAEEETSASAVIKNLRAGVRQLFNTPVLRSLFMVQVIIFTSYGLWSVLVLPFALRALKATEFEYGVQEGLTSLGFVAGSLLMVKLFDRLQVGAWMVISCLGMGVFGIAYAGSQSIPLAIGLATLAGFFNSPHAIARSVIVQRNTPAEMRGRVSSAFLVASNLMYLISMGAAGLADRFDLRQSVLISQVMLAVVGIIYLILPEFGQSRSQWKRTITLLKGVEAAPRLGLGRPASTIEVERFIHHMPALAGLSQKERMELASETLIAESKPGQMITYRGETSDMAYFILKGSVSVGYIRQDEYVILNYLHEGDFFGEMAALMGMTRSANVITEEDCEFLVIPADVMRALESRHPTVRTIFYRTMTERLSEIELPHTVGLNQHLLRELRTAQPDMETPSAAA